MRIGSVGLLAATALLVVATPALAAQGTLSAQTGLPWTVTGDHAVSAEEASFLLEGQKGTASLVLQGVSAEATRVVHRAWGYVRTDDPKAEVLWDDAVESVPVPLDGAMLTLKERRQGFQILAYESPLLVEGDASGDLLLGALEHPKGVDYQLDSMLSVRLMPPDDADRFSRVIPAGHFAARSDDGRLQSQGPVQVFVSDAVLSYYPANGDPSEELRAHFRVEEKPHGVYNPVTREWTGPGTHTEYIQEYLLVDLQEGLLRVSYAGTPGTLYAERPQVEVLGEALLPAAVGTLTVTDEDGTHVHRLSKAVGEDLQLAGDFTLRPHGAQLGSQSEGARTGVEGEGDFTYVSYGAVAAEYDWAKTLTAVGIGAAAIAVLALVGKAVAGALAPAVAGYARVSGNEVLEHPGRHEVYERVKAFPGVSFIQLSDQVSFGASTLNYHLRVLEKNDYIISVKDGRYLRFFDRQSGLYAGAKKDAVSALRNPNTAAIAKHILQNPGVPQCDLATKFGITASTVNWHINRLATAGLVQRQRDAHYTRYFVGEAWASLPADEQARFAQPVAPLVVA